MKFRISLIAVVSLFITAGAIAGEASTDGSSPPNAGASAQASQGSTASSQEGSSGDATDSHDGASGESTSEKDNDSADASEQDADAQADAQADSEADAQADSEADSEADAQADSEADAQAEAEAGTEADAEAEASAEAEAGSEETGGAEAQAEAGAGGAGGADGAAGGAAGGAGGEGGASGQSHTWRVTIANLPGVFRLSWDAYPQAPFSGNPHYSSVHYLVEHYENSVWRAVPGGKVGTHEHKTLDVAIAPHNFNWLSNAYRVRACHTSNNSCFSTSAAASLTFIHSRQVTSYIKAYYRGDTDDSFGEAVALSDDGRTMAIGVPSENGRSSGINAGTQKGYYDSGAVYIYKRKNLNWVFNAYIKAHNNTFSNAFGSSVALNADGTRLAVGAPFEDSPSDSRFIQDDSYVSNSGAVYVYHIPPNGASGPHGKLWRRANFLKAPIGDENDQFGFSVDLSNDGNILAVGAPYEDATGYDATLAQNNNNRRDSGAVYIYQNSNHPSIPQWRFRDYIKGVSYVPVENFGYRVQLSGNGNLLVASSVGYAFDGTGINPGQFLYSGVSSQRSGAVAAYVYDGKGWQRQAFFKASNAERDDLFGHSLSLSNDGKTLAVGAPGEDSTAKSINGSQSNNSGSNVGAVYIFTRAGDTWRQQTYIKATTSENGFNFGHAVALSGNGEYLAVGVPNDDSGLGGVQVFYSFDNLYTDAGAVYMYKRNGNTWSTGRFVKSPNPGYGDKFGHAVALSANGNTLLAGAPGENGGSTGIDGDRSSNSLSNSGAAYLFGGGSIDELLSVKNAFLGEMSIKRNAFQGAIATSASSGNISYSSNSSNVTVYSNGALYSSRTSGKSTITVTSTGDRNYFAATMRYDVTVNSNNWSVRRSFDGNSVKINWQERPGTYRYYLVQSTNNGSYQPAPAARLVKRGATYEFIHNVDPLKLDWSSIRYRFRGCNVGNTYCTTISEFDLDDILTTSSYIKRFREPLPSGETRTQSERRNYGIAVAMNKPGTMLVAGSPGGNSGNGSARVYARDNNGVWRLDGQIQPRITYINGNFGGALAVSSTNATIAVGARGLNIGQSGFVYIFKKSSGVWREEARLRSTVLDSYDYFGSSVALSDDGNTLAVGAEGEDSNATGINGSATNNSAAASGAVYVFERTGSTWTQRYYIKANRVVANAKFGSSISLNGDGDVMAVGAFQDSTYSTGINGTIYTGSRTYSGAAYVFVRTATTWRQEAYIKPSSISSYDYFGTSVSLSGEGDILAVGAPGDDTGQTTGTGFVNNNSTPNSGAVTMYHYIEGSWRSTAFLKAANVGNSDQFGSSIALSANGAFLAVGAKGEDGGSSGINGNLSSNSNTNSGAVYYFERLAVNDGWSYKSYIKATSPRQQNGFGSALAISAGGNTMVVGAPNDLGYGVYSASTYDPGSFYLYGGHKVDRWLRTLGTHRGAMQAVYGQPIVGGVVSHTTYDPGYVYQAYSSFWLNYDSAWNRLYFHYRPTRKTEARIRVSGYGTSTFYPTATIYRVHISQHNIRTAVTLPEGKTRFTWSGAQSAHHYEIRRYDHLRGSAYKFHNVADIASSAREVSIDTALLRLHAGDKYALFACSEFNACALQSEFNFDTTSLIKSTYVKASNTGSYDYFGNTVAVSGDGNTMVVGAPYEDSNTTGINGSGNNNNASNSGAVYIYVRSNGQWTQQAYIKASNASRLRDSHFGYSIALLSPAYLVVGAPKESVVLGSGSSQSTVSRAGAVYVFRRTGTTWSEYKRLVASNPNTGDDFGHSVDVSLASNSLVVAVGAPGEDSNSRTTYNGTQNNNSATNSGAAYVFARPNYPISWSQQAYIKALNSDAGDRFGHAVALSRDASNLLVGAPDEDSRASGVNGINHDNSVTNSGAAYVFSSYREDGRNPWNFKNYIKASNPDSGDQFGSSVSMISYGSPLAIGAPGEDSSSAIINGSQGNPFGLNYDSGAAYVFNGMGSLMRQINYIKPSNPGRGDNFGATLSLHSYQGFLAVGARNEDSSIALEDGGALTADDTLANSGAVYTYEDAHNTNVRQLRFFKASNAGAGDNFGFSVSLGGAGSVLAIGANFEDGFYSGINRPSNNNSYTRSGATYIFESISD